MPQHALEKWKPPTDGGDETPGCIEKFGILAGASLVLLFALPVLAFLAIRQ